MKTVNDTVDHHVDRLLVAKVVYHVELLITPNTLDTQGNLRVFSRYSTTPRMFWCGDVVTREYDDDVSPFYSEPNWVVQQNPSVAKELKNSSILLIATVKEGGIVPFHTYTLYIRFQQGKPATVLRTEYIQGKEYASLKQKLIYNNGREVFWNGRKLVRVNEWGDIAVSLQELLEVAIAKGITDSGSSSDSDSSSSSDSDSSSGSDTD